MVPFTVVRRLVFPALFNSLSHPLSILLPVIFVQIGSLDIRGGASVGIVKQAVRGV